VRPCLIAALVVTALWGAGSARAEPRDPATAEVLFRTGRLHSLAGEYAAVCPLFAESLRLDPAPGTLLNLADCEEHIGRTATAWAHFRELSRELPGPTIAIRSPPSARPPLRSACRI
jgi:TolA-binding protein